MKRLLVWLSVQNWHRVMLAFGAALTAEQVLAAHSIPDKVGAFCLALLMLLVRPSQTSVVVEKVSDAIPGTKKPAEPPPAVLP